MYIYKMNDMQEFEDEARQVTREHKVGKLDPTKQATKYERQLRYKRRKEMLNGTNKLKM